MRDRIQLYIRHGIRWSLAAMICCSLTMQTAAGADPDTADAAPAVRHPLAKLFANPAILRGTLGGAQIQMELHLKPGESGTLEGSYFIFGHTQKIQLAGEFEEDALSMEESANGQDVSGLWDGAYDGATLTGNWSTTEGVVVHPFVLKVIPAK
ncbi:MAG: hypothetical protein JWP38_1219 [Herbaspirillum sp.]|jgi:hypothetical protein|nr:hypothetical protein [Herbaspirillum sp.]